MLFDKQPQQVTVERRFYYNIIVKFCQHKGIRHFKYSKISKAYGHDDILIRMLKLSSKSILKPLKLLFENCLRTGIFPDQWKKANIVPIHKKGDKQLFKNYRPVSLLPICAWVFERIIFNGLFKYFKENNLLSPH